MHPFFDWTEQYLFFCKYEKNLSNKTIKAYDLDLNQFKNYLKNKKITLDNNLDKEIIREYLKHLLQKSKSTTVKRKMATLKGLFNYLEEEGKYELNPFTGIKIKLKLPLQLPKVLTLEEVQKLLGLLYKKLNNEKTTTLIRDIAIIELLFATGARVSELCNLVSADIDLENGIIKIRGKGSRERIAQIFNKEALSLLKDYFLHYEDRINESGFFFVNRLGKRLSEQSVRLMIKKYTGKLNFNKKVTPHMFRHTFATTLLDQGVDIRYIQHFLGHSSILTTQIYTHVSNTKQTEILASKHPREQFKFL